MKNQPTKPAIKISGYKISQPDSDILTIEKSWKESLIPFIMLSVFFIMWYYGLLMTGESTEPNMFKRIVEIIKVEPFLIIFFIAPLIIILPIIVKFITSFLNRETFYIDGKRGTITKNNRLITSFSDITKLRYVPNKPTIILELKKLDKVELVRSRSHHGVRKVADILSKLTKLKISN